MLSRLRHAVGAKQQEEIQRIAESAPCLQETCALVADPVSGIYRLSDADREGP